MAKEGKEAREKSQGEGGETRGEANRGGRAGGKEEEEEA